MMMKKRKIMSLINQSKFANRRKKVELNNKWLCFTRRKSFGVRKNLNPRVCLMYRQPSMKKYGKAIIIITIRIMKIIIIVRTIIKFLSKNQKAKKMGKYGTSILEKLLQLV